MLVTWGTDTSTASLADSMAIGSWRLRVALDGRHCERLNDTAGAMFAQLVALVRDPLGTRSDRRCCVMLSVSGGEPHNAIDRLSLLFLGNCLLNGVLELPKSEKQLFVVAPQQVSAHFFAKKLEGLAGSIGISVSTRVDDFTELSQFVTDLLARTLLLHVLKIRGCILVGRKPNPRVLLTSDLMSGEKLAATIKNLVASTDPAGRVFVEFDCIPAIMTLQTVADADNIDELKKRRLLVLPRLGSGWLVSCHKDPPGQSPLQVLETKPAQPDDFRLYWQMVYGICLPANLGGFVRVRFSSHSVLTYPACCVMSEWSAMPKQTRAESMQVVRRLLTLLRCIFGEDSVTANSSMEKPARSAVFLPASALVEPPIENVGSRRGNFQEHHSSRKKRMLS